ncbi:hypothetical protein P692DRAFT_20906586 [Suillus brevipes Sb2]|nr:hypothetical protein P692DRAFT_20906586 [Suillus brevipes Sb2]
MKLIDTAKDTRITHLLWQTDVYLNLLAQAVLARQNESGSLDTNFDQNEGPANETTFGAQDDKIRVDYHVIAHHISEKVVKQPGVLIGSQLKVYQLKGPQWMVSLYNNKLNDILADEISYKGNIATSEANLRMGQFQVLLTTYEYVFRTQPILSKLKWVHVIMNRR